jgi:hypothetical protein
MFVPPIREVLPPALEEWLEVFGRDVLPKLVR